MPFVFDLTGVCSLQVFDVIEPLYLSPGGGQMFINNSIFEDIFNFEVVLLSRVAAYQSVTKKADKRSEIVLKCRHKFYTKNIIMRRSRRKTMHIPQPWHHT